MKSDSRFSAGECPMRRELIADLTAAQQREIALGCQRKACEHWKQGCNMWRTYQAICKDLREYGDA